MQTTTKNTKISWAGVNLNELQKIAKSIRAGHEAVEEAVKVAKQKTNEALGEAILVGDKLLKAKDICGYGRFMAWTQETLSKISHRTLNKYMKLAEANKKLGGDLLKSEHGLRQAYIVLGIIKEEEEKAAPSTPQAQEQSAAPEPTIATLVPGVDVQPKTIVALQEAIQSTEPQAIEPQAIEAQPSNTLPLPVATNFEKRASFLMDELLIDLSNKIQTNSLSIERAEQITMQRLKAFFADIRSSKAEAA